MDKPAKIYYIAHCRFPSERAHAIQVAKMVEAMRLAGADVELVLPKRKNEITKTAKEFYGLKTEIPVHHVSVLDLYSFKFYALNPCLYRSRLFFFPILKKHSNNRQKDYRVNRDRDFEIYALLFLKQTRSFFA